MAMLRVYFVRWDGNLCDGDEDDEERAPARLETPDGARVRGIGGDVTQLTNYSVGKELK